MARPELGVSVSETDAPYLGHPAKTLHPYLKAFSADAGVVEFELRKRCVTIGRSAEADITLANRSVSRVHARILRHGDVFNVEDAGSTAGTLLNGEPASKRDLHHGDTIEIGVYMLQFRMEREASGADDAAERARTLLRGKYNTLPSSVKIRYRILSQATSGMASANTLPTERGGLLIPTSAPPDDGASIELQMTVPGGNTGCLLGELTGVIEKGDTYWMCVRIHRLPKVQHEIVVAGTSPGRWVDVGATSQ